jgi:hypothetical protein
MHSVLFCYIIKVFEISFLINVFDHILRIIGDKI